MAFTASPSISPLSRYFSFALGVLLALACTPKQSNTALEAQGDSADTNEPKRATGPLSPMQQNLSEHLAPYFSFGVAMEPHYLDEFGPILSSTFNRLTAENAMKCARIHPQEDTYNYAPADQLADFARKHQMAMTGHALVWYRETPDWLVQGDKAQVLAKLQSHVDAVVLRYADVTDNWDVINEAVSDSADKIYRDGDEQSKLYPILGEDLFTETFRFAEAAMKKSGKNIDLYYNDYNLAKPEKLEKALKLAKKVKDAGVRIDGIGEQAHWSMTWPTTSELQQMIDKIVAAGLKVKISELDISIYPNDDWENKKWEPQREFTPQLAQAQAARYKELFDVFVKNAEHITSVTVWGLTDDRTWLDDFPAKSRNNHPLLFNDNAEPKPAYFALFEVGNETSAK